MERDGQVPGVQVGRRSMVRFLTIANEEVYTELFVRLKSFVERHLN